MIGKSRVVVLVGFENATFVWKPRSGMEKRDQALGVKPCDLEATLYWSRLQTPAVSPLYSATVDGDVGQLMNSFQL